MVVFVDLSKKLVGFNLFESLFYQLKNEGTIAFANNPLTVDDIGFDYAGIREAVQNLLYDHHVSSWSLCVLYDMDDQANDPINSSITANVRIVYERIIAPLLQEYTFNKLYYLSLDEIKRNLDGIPLDSNIRTAIAFDAAGYINETCSSSYADMLISSEELCRIDNSWSEIKKAYITADNLRISDPKAVAKSLSTEIDKVFNQKINAVDARGQEYHWYRERLESVLKNVKASLENAIFKNMESVHSIEAPSKQLISALKMHVSSYATTETVSTVILHFPLADRNSALSKQVLLYRHQLEILATLIFLATNDTKMIFESGNTIGRDNHWEVKIFLKDENLAAMLSTYNFKLKAELEKLGKFVVSEIEYNEFSPRSFNLAVEMKKPPMPATFTPGVFYKKDDSTCLEEYSGKLFRRYEDATRSAGKRIREMSSKLRVQKESISVGKLKRGSASDVCDELNKMQDDIKRLQRETALYRPKDIADLSTEIKQEYASRTDSIQYLLRNRIPAATMLKNSLLIMAASLCMYPLLQLFGTPGKDMLILTIAMLLLPAACYAAIQLSIAILMKKRIVRKIQELTSANEREVNTLYNDDNNTSKYVVDVYNLIMQKKYVTDCTEKVAAANSIFKQCNYHKSALKDHIEVSNKLIELLATQTAKPELLNMDGMEELNRSAEANKNKLYCPLEYMLLAEPVENNALINGQQKVEINNNLLGFVDKFEISHDKEYSHA